MTETIKELLSPFDGSVNKQNLFKISWRKAASDISFLNQRRLTNSCCQEIFTADRIIDSERHEKLIEQQRAPTLKKLRNVKIGEKVLLEKSFEDN